MFKFPWVKHTNALDENERQWFNELKQQFPQLQQANADYQSANRRLVYQYDKLAKQLTDFKTKVMQLTQRQNKLNQRIHDQKMLINRQKNQIQQLMGQKNRHDQQVKINHQRKQINQLLAKQKSGKDNANEDKLRSLLKQKRRRESELNTHIHHQKNVIAAQDMEIKALRQQLQSNANHSIDHVYMQD